MVSTFSNYAPSKTTLERQIVYPIHIFGTVIVTFLQCNNLQLHIAQFGKLLCVHSQSDHDIMLLILIQANMTSRLFNWNVVIPVNTSIIELSLYVLAF